MQSIEKLQAEIEYLRQRVTELEAVQGANLSIRHAKTLVSSLPHGILFETAERKVLLANQPFCDIFGVPSPEILLNADCAASAEASKHLFENPQQFVSDIQATVTTRKSVMGHTLHMQDGRILSRDYTPVHNEQGVFIGHLWIYNDITEQVARMRKLSEQERSQRDLVALMRVMADNMPDLVWAKDMEKRYIFVNRAMCQKLLNATDTQEPLGKTDMFFADRERAAHPENPEYHTFGELCTDSDTVVMKNKRPQRFDEWGNVKGKFLALDVYKSPIFNEAGAMIGTVGIGRDVTREKEIERNLNQTQELFRRVVEEARDGIMVIDEAGRVVIWNAAMARITGRSVTDVLGKPAVEIQFENLPPAHRTPEARKRIESILQEILRTGTYPTLHQFHRYHFASTGDGETVVEESSFTIKTEKGFQLVSIHRDITAQVAQEQQVRLLSGVVEAAAEIIIITDVDGNIEYVNPAYERLTGHSLADVLGQTPRINKSGEHPQEFYEHMWETILAGKRFRGIVINRKKDGSTYAEEKIITPIFDGRGEITHFVSTGRDITERLSMEKALQHSRNRYDIATSAGDVGIWEWNLSTNDLFLDSHLKAMLGYTDDEIENTVEAWFTLIHPEDVAEVVQKLQEHAQGLTQVHQVSYRVKHKNGSIRWLQAQGAMTRDESGKVTRMVGTNTDITELMEARLQAETLREVTLALVSHTELDDILAEIFVQARKLIAFSTANVGLVTKNQLKIVAATGYEKYGSADFMTDLEHVIDDYPITFTPLRTKQPIVVPNVVEEPRWLTFEPTAWIKSYLGFPLILHDTVLGLLQFDFDTPNAVSAADIDRLQPLAAAAAVAIQHAQLLAESRKRAEQMALVHTVGGQVNRLLALDDILATAVTIIHRTLNYAVVQIAVLNDDKTALQLLHRAGMPMKENVTKVQPITAGVMGRAVRTGKTQWVADTTADPDYLVCSADVRSEITVPIVVNDDVFGVLDVNAVAANAFDKSDVQALETLAKQLGTIIENARLFAQTKVDAETKTVLLREVNHRVKNNLASIIGLLYLERRQNRDNPNVDFSVVMDDAINRVRGMATAHQMLSASEWQPILLDELVRQIIRTVTESMSPEKYVRVNVPSSPVKIVATQAANIALVINELATNTIKHGIAESLTPAIDVTITQDDDHIVIEYRDNGTGYDDAVLNLTTHNIGMDLVKNMARNALQGSLSLKNDHGAVTTLRFPLKVRE